MASKQDKAPTILPDITRPCRKLLYRVFRSTLDHLMEKSGCPQVISLSLHAYVSQSFLEVVCILSGWCRRFLFATEQGRELSRQYSKTLSCYLDPIEFFSKTL